MPDHTDSPVTSTNESHDRDLNRHRRDEERRARSELVGRLLDRAIEVDAGASDEIVVELWEAVEAFEAGVEARGGDLMVDSPPSHEPDNPRFVLPRREASEPLDRFTARIRAATDRLRSSRAD